MPYQMAVKGVIIFYREGGKRLFVGGMVFFGGGQSGRPVFFSRPKRGPEFFEGQRGGDQIFWSFEQFLLKYIIQNVFAPLTQPFSLAYFMPYNIFIYIIMFFSTPGHSQFN